MRAARERRRREVEWRERKEEGDTARQGTRN